MLEALAHTKIANELTVLSVVGKERNEATLVFLEMSGQNRTSGESSIFVPEGSNVIKEDVPMSVIKRPLPSELDQTKVAQFMDAISVSDAAFSRARAT
jgi:hypothetical protein